MEIENVEKVVGFDLKTSKWETYKGMINDVYYNQKNRSQFLDKIHNDLEKVGDMVEEQGFEYTAEWMEQICLMMKDYVYSGFENESAPLKLNRNCRIPLPNIITDDDIKREIISIITNCYVDAYFRPKEVYHYLD